jgi:hypothetical protein
MRCLILYEELKIEFIEDPENDFSLKIGEEKIEKLINDVKYKNNKFKHRC